MFVIDGRKYDGTYFTKESTHQEKAVDAINKVFDGVEIIKPRQFFENPIINLSDSRISQKISKLQKGLPSEYRASSPIRDVLNLDIKMETGGRCHNSDRVHKCFNIKGFRNFN